MRLVDDSVTAQEAVFRNKTDFVNDVAEPRQRDVFYNLVDPELEQFAIQANRQQSTDREVYELAN